MPLFEYRCKTCSKLFEAYKRPSDVEKGETCPECGGKSAKVEISLVGSAGSGGDPGSKNSQCGSGSRRSPFS
jgi:putative FmdB family regulatory protein